ncbi:hypothetical protein VNO80_13269 [Phaseolus coccineus]|uniref:Uncharacterized protein n=1 Tax=Phaseolus coccineus TaxID=3886 RepID=A0AAN9R9S2_PHACN
MDSMLGTLEKKDLATRAKLLKDTAQVPPTEDLKLNEMVEVAPSDDEDTCSGPLFKRRRKVVSVPTEHSAADGRAPSQQALPPSPSPPRGIMVQESRGENL